MTPDPPDLVLQQQIAAALVRVTDAEAAAATAQAAFVTVEQEDLHLVLRFLATLARRHARELPALAAAAARARGRCASRGRVRGRRAR